MMNKYFGGKFGEEIKETVTIEPKWTEKVLKFLWTILKITLWIVTTFFICKYICEIKRGNYQPLAVVIGLISFFAFPWYFWPRSEYQKEKWEWEETAEEKSLKTIKEFIIKKKLTSEDYLLVPNLIFQSNYWSCEIDILLLTKKWIYVFEIKNWSVKWISGSLNDEYLKFSPGGPYKGKFKYSPFFQNEQHINRFKKYFQLPNDNILGVVCFNSSFEFRVRKDKKLFFENKHLWASNNNYSEKNIFNLLTDYENIQKNKLSFFQELREKLENYLIFNNKEELKKKHVVFCEKVKKILEKRKDKLDEKEKNLRKGWEIN